MKLKEDGSGRKRNFKPAVFPHYHSAADKGNGGDLWKDRVELFSTKHTLIVRAKEVLSLPFL